MYVIIIVISIYIPGVDFEFDGDFGEVGVLVLLFDTVDCEEGSVDCRVSLEVG